MRSAATALLALAGCLEFSPHQLPEDRGLNLRAIEALADRPAVHPIRFAVIGDVQGHSDDARDAVASPNAREDVTFVVQLGDFTDYGLAFEFWVPARWGGRDLVSLTGRLTWLPLSIAAGGWRLRPATLALAGSHTWGRGFWLEQPGRCPGGYYASPTALRLTLALGGALVRQRGPLAGVGMFAEIVALDVANLHWIRNPRTTASDVLSLAVGVRAEF